MDEAVREEIAPGSGGDLNLEKFGKSLGLVGT
jgi:hypothetical protein